MANQVIIANSKEVFKDQTYNTLNPMSSGVVQYNANVPEAVMLEATGVSWGHYTITQQILRLLMRNKAPLEVFRPDYSHKGEGRETGVQYCPEPVHIVTGKQIGRASGRERV